MILLFGNTQIGSPPNRNRFQRCRIERIIGVTGTSVHGALQFGFSGVAGVALFRHSIDLPRVIPRVVFCAEIDFGQLVLVIRIGRLLRVVAKLVIRAVWGRCIAAHDSVESSLGYGGTFAKLP